MHNLTYGLREYQKICKTIRKLKLQRTKRKVILNDYYEKNLWMDWMILIPQAHGYSFSMSTKWYVKLNN